VGSDGGTIFDLRLNLEGERAAGTMLGRRRPRAGAVAKTSRVLWTKGTLRLKNLMDRQGCLSSFGV